MEALFQLFPFECVGYFRRLYAVGFFVGSAMIIPTVLVLRDTADLTDMWCDKFFRLVHVFRLLFFICQLPFRVYIYMQLRKALDVPERAGVVNQLLSVIRGRAWRCSQYLGITHSLMCAALLLFVLVDFAIPGRVLAFGTRLVLAVVSPVITRTLRVDARFDAMSANNGLCGRGDVMWPLGSIALYGLALVHLVAFVFQFSLSMKWLNQLTDPDQMYESIVWRLGTTDDQIEANTSVVTYDPAVHSPEAHASSSAVSPVTVKNVLIRATTPVLSLSGDTLTPIATTAVTDSSSSQAILVPAAVKLTAPTLRSRIVLSAQTQGLTSPPVTPRIIHGNITPSGMAGTTGRLTPDIIGIGAAAVPLPLPIAAAAVAATAIGLESGSAVPAVIADPTTHGAATSSASSAPSSAADSEPVFTAAATAKPRVLAFCAICQDGFSSGDRVRMLRCHETHNFHVACIDTWLHKKAICPLCLTGLNAPTPAPTPAPAPAPAPTTTPHQQQSQQPQSRTITTSAVSAPATALERPTPPATPSSHATTPQAVSVGGDS